MKCSIVGCPGEYELRNVVHTFQRGNQTMVVEDVPAKVCTSCGDTLFSASTVRSLENLLLAPPTAAHTVPAFSFPQSATHSEIAH